MLLMAELSEMTLRRTKDLIPCFDRPDLLVLMFTSLSWKWSCCGDSLIAGKRS